MPAATSDFDQTLNASEAGSPVLPDCSRARALPSYSRSSPKARSSSPAARASYSSAVQGPACLGTGSKPCATVASQQVLDGLPLLPVPGRQQAQAQHQDLGQQGVCRPTSDSSGPRENPPPPWPPGPGGGNSRRAAAPQSATGPARTWRPRRTRQDPSSQHLTPLGRDARVHHVAQDLPQLRQVPGQFLDALLHLAVIAAPAILGLLQGVPRGSGPGAGPGATGPRPRPGAPECPW